MKFSKLLISSPLAFILFFFMILSIFSMFISLILGRLEAAYLFGLDMVIFNFLFLSEGLKR